MQLLHEIGISKLAIASKIIKQSKDEVRVKRHIVNSFGSELHVIYVIKLFVLLLCFVLLHLCVIQVQPPNYVAT